MRYRRSNFDPRRHGRRREGAGGRSAGVAIERVAARVIGLVERGREGVLHLNTVSLSLPECVCVTESELHAGNTKREAELTFDHDSGTNEGRD